MGGILDQFHQSESQQRSFRGEALSSVDIELKGGCEQVQQKLNAGFFFVTSS